MSRICSNDNDNFADLESCQNKNDEHWDGTLRNPNDDEITHWFDRRRIKTQIHNPIYDDWPKNRKHEFRSIYVKSIHHRGNDDFYCFRELRI